MIERRQFDFWLGDWEVRTPDGALAGRSRIRRTCGGMGLREDWRGKTGLVGTSLNIWSAERSAWHQTWMDSSGTLLVLEGGLQDGAMVMEGTTADPDRPGSALRHRITWSLVDGDPDRLRQHWQTSADGKAWETAFDGQYARARPRG